jgi:hypothetical protein
MPAGVELLEGSILDFRDAWGNRIELIGYDDVQFTRRPTCLVWPDALGQERESKKELADNGIELELKDAAAGTDVRGNARVSLCSVPDSKFKILCWLAGK